VPAPTQWFAAFETKQKTTQNSISKDCCNNSQRMPESSTNVEPKGKKDNLKRRNSASQNKHIEANV